MIHVLFVTAQVNDILALMPYATHRQLKFTIVSSIQEALVELINQQNIDMIIADKQLSDGLGVELLAKANGQRMYLVVTHDALLKPEELRVPGVYEVLTGPVSVPMLETIFNENPLKKPLMAIPTVALEGLLVDGFIGESLVMHRMRDLIKKVAPTKVSVFIHGPSGCGKELVAQAIHRNSQRADRPFLALNCGAVTEELIASALFGHEKGSFTGAIHNHKGYFEQASGGTLFLDEITETSKALQISLLRVLETLQVMPVGSRRSVDVDVRILASTNREPLIAMQQGFLREDLYHRLNVFSIKVPALAERHQDIALLAEFFLNEHNEQNHTNKSITAQALQHLQSLPYPGNVRQLKNRIHRAYILAYDSIDVEHMADD